MLLFRVNLPWCSHEWKPKSLLTEFTKGKAKTWTKRIGKQGEEIGGKASVDKRDNGMMRKRDKAR